MDNVAKQTRHGYYLSLTSYSIGHFCADFSCAFLLFRLCAIGVVRDEQIWSSFLLYNILAFGLEVFIGVFFNKNSARFCACLGCLFLIVSSFIGLYIERSVLSFNTYLSSVDINTNFTSEFLSGRDYFHRLATFSILAIVLAGVGNAFFHVGGGIDSLSRSQGKYWRSGVFISTGAIGLAFGGIEGRALTLAFSPVLLILTIILGLLWFTCKLQSDSSCTAFSSVREGFIGSDESSDNPTWQIIPLFAACFVIVSRSFIGFSAPSLLTQFDGSFPLLLAFASFVGKFIGGILTDLLGAKKVGSLALLLSIPLLCYSNSMEIFLVGVVCLNISTSITLVSVSNSCSQRYGFAFGITTIALLGGFLTDCLLKEMYPEGVDFHILRSSIVSILFLSTIALYLSINTESPKETPKIN